MTALKQIEERLRKYPQIRFESSDSHISIFPVSDSGFEVAIYADQLDGTDTAYTVHYEGWHEHDLTEEEALELVALGLSTSSRIREYSRAGQPYKWKMEFRSDDGEWSDGGTVGTIPWSFWKKVTETILQNDVVK